MKHEVKDIKPYLIAQLKEQHGGCPRGVLDDVNDVVHTVVFNDLFVYIVLFGELFATQGLHQEHEEPYPHRSEDGEEDDGEPQGRLGNETGQFVHERFCL